MGKFIKNFFKVSLSNIVSLLSGVLLGFIVPKILNLDGYANYKTYTLYLTYISLLSFGLCDGLYLKFCGIDKKELNKDVIRYYLRKYYIQLIIFFIVALAVALFCLPVEYKVIGVFLALSILTTQITCIHQNLSLITSSFNEYSVRVIMLSLLKCALVVGLYVAYKLLGQEVSYEYFVGGLIVLDAIMVIWYIYTYRDFNFGHIASTIELPVGYSTLLLMGFPLLLSNMAGSIFMSLDRQFVSILFNKSEYAVYAFAYNMLTLITSFTSAVSSILLPSLRKIQNIDVCSSLNKYMALFNSIVAGGLLVYFPLCWFVPTVLPKYSGALEIFRIVLPGIILSTSVSVILINFYKLENKVMIYFSITSVSIVVSIISNYIAFKYFHSYQAISWASVFSIFVWYLLTMSFFVVKYKIMFATNTLYIIFIGASFYFVTSFITNYKISGIVYFGIYVCSTILFIFKRKMILNNKLSIKA